VDRILATHAGSLARPARLLAFLAAKDRGGVLEASAYWLRNEYYPSDEDFVFALADALHEEYQAIVDAGLLLQVDDAVLMHECDTMLSRGESFVPGVVTHHTNVVEHPELVAQRLTRLANVVGRDRVIAGTDCGFAQGAFVTRVHPEIQWAKLAALAEGARLATRELWGAKAAV
jgi:methionine synthase II (cobalamin-independent)